MRHFHHLTIFEREEILRLKLKGLSYRQIALRINKDVSTISRELNRSSVREEYSPTKAHIDYLTKRLKSKRTLILKSNKELKDKVESLILDKHWSPEQIINRMKVERYKYRISYPTIYRYIWQHNFGWTKRNHGHKLFSRNLRHKGRARHKSGVIDKRADSILNDSYTPIQDRPNFINKRQRIGDWELDTVLGKQNKGALVTIVDRFSRYVLIGRIKNKSAAQVNEVITSLLQEIDSYFIHSITPDHGKEFKQLEIIMQRFDIPVYLPDAYSPHQRGSNENINGLLREFFPKKTDLSNYTDVQIKSWQDNLNTRPKKILGYKTPSEVFNDEVLHLI
jgi:IS30 family transposase